MGKRITLSLFPEVIFGAEGEETEEVSNPSQEEAEGNETDDGEVTGGNSSGQTHEDADDPNVKGLRSALESERARAKAAEKALKAAQKKEQDRELSEKTELEQAQAREKQASSRVEKLASGYLQREIDSAIASAAKEQRFTDPADAVALIDRSKLVFSQDEDDPTDVTIDEKTVVAAVKALVAKKPHLLQSGTDDGGPTGGQFGGGRKRKPTDEETLRNKYPSLR